jgi:hypothetical protein
MKKKVGSPAKVKVDKQLSPVIIRTNCTGADTMPLNKILGLQGNLKELSSENYGKLLALMVKDGFSFPLTVARLKGKPHGVIDGHQRHKVVAQAIAEGATLTDAAGRKVDALPVVWVECRHKRHAARLILAAVSQFGKVSDDGLNEFMIANEIDFSALPCYDLPDFDAEKFSAVFANEGDGGKGPDEFSKVDETIDTEHTCPKCGYKWSGGK